MWKKQSDMQYYTNKHHTNSLATTHAFTSNILHGQLNLLAETSERKSFCTSSLAMTYHLLSASSGHICSPVFCMKMMEKLNKLFPPLKEETNSMPSPAPSHTALAGVILNSGSEEEEMK